MAINPIDEVTRIQVTQPECRIPNHEPLVQHLMELGNLAASAGDLKEIDQFDAWAKAALTRVEFEEEHDLQDMHTYEACGYIVWQAGKAAARVGLVGLCEESMDIAPHREHLAVGTVGCICRPVQARLFLAKCIASCRSYRGGSNEGERAKGPQRRDATKPSCTEKAYSEFCLARRALGVSVTNKQAYKFAFDRSKAAKEDSFPPYETWTRYVRTEKAKLNETQTR